MSNVMTYADICKAAKTLSDMNPRFKCRECGSGFYWRPGPGWRHGDQPPSLCEDCDFGEQFRGMRVGTNR